VRPSGFTATETGIEPFGAPRTSATSIVAMTLSVRVSMTETVSVFALAV